MAILPAPARLLSTLALSALLAFASPAAAATNAWQQDATAKDIAGTVCWSLHTQLEDGSSLYLAGVHADPKKHKAADVMAWALGANAFRAWDSGQQVEDANTLAMLDLKLTSFQWTTFTIKRVSLQSDLYLVDFWSSGLILAGRAVAMASANCAPGTATHVEDHRWGTADGLTSDAHRTQNAAFGNGAAEADCTRTDNRHIDYSTNPPTETSSHVAGGTVHIYGIPMVALDCSAGVDMGSGSCNFTTRPINVGGAMVSASATSIDLQVLKFVVSFDGSGIAKCTAVNAIV